LELIFQLGCGVVFTRSCGVRAESTPVICSPELKLDPTRRSWCVFGKVEPHAGWCWRSLGQLVV